MNYKSKTSTLTLLDNFFNSEQDEVIAVSKLLEVLSERAFGLVLLFLALPNAMLLSSIPGVSALFGVPIILIAGQMVMSRTRLWLPASFNDKRIKRSDCMRFLNISRSYIQWLEQFALPRLLWVTSAAFEKIIGVFCLFIGIIIALPIPLGNFFGGICLLLIALGLIEKDGVFIGIGCLSAILFAIILSLIFKSVILGVLQLF